MEVVTELFELIAVKLFVVVRYNGVGYSILANDVLIYILFDFDWCDGCECFGFEPLGKVVDSYHNVLDAALSLRELSN